MNNTDNDNLRNISKSDYFDRLHKTMGANRDTGGLGMVVGPFVVGRVDAITGEGGKEMPEFVPTRHELKHLAEYWALERIDRDFYWFVCQQSGSSDWRWSVYINRRLARLTEILGNDVMGSVWNAATVSFRKRSPEVTDEDWRIFMEGTEGEQEAWRERLCEEYEKEDGEVKQ